MAPEAAEEAPARHGRRSPRRALFWVFLCACALLGAKRVVLQTRALAVVEHYPAAVDLKIRYRETQSWWDGRPVYREVRSADYPPATYVMLWPFLRPWSFATARLIWCTLSLAALGVLSWTFARAVRPEPSRVALAALLPIFASPTAATIGAGQFGLVVLAATVSSVLLVEGRDGRTAGVASGALAWLGLSKPTVTAPLTLALVSTVSGWWAAAFAGTAYAGATALACSAQPVPLAECLGGWIRQGIGFTDVGYGNVATWANAAGHPRWVVPLAFVLLVGVAAWLWRNPRAHLWTRLGVLGCVARLWTYHYGADDVLIYLPIIGLLTAAPKGLAGKLGDLLVAASIVLLLTPTSIVQRQAFQTKFLAAMVVVEIGMLVLLARLGNAEHRAAPVEGVSADVTAMPRRA